ncbi:MAG: tRNA epoxyqueuosine(34) reductase QueG [Anaerolineales bacterium]
MSEVSPSELKRRLLVRARDLGFALAGVTTADPPPHVDVYEEWLEHNRHGEMEYLQRSRNRRARSNPRDLLPECESILVVGVNYLSRDDESGPSAPARVSNYAVGDDYHDLIPARLQELMQELEAWAGEPVPHRIYTDTGPILERELAQRAGLGWIGKNTCLINPNRGSYFFLAEVLLGLKLPADDPMKADHCGSCTRCIDACPTSCIRQDRTLDARHCISYLTIELRGEIPPDLREQVGGWVFGCDICQQVCPWNVRFAGASEEPAFQSRPFFQDAELSDYLTMDDEVYRRTFKGSPLKRAKRHGLARNAAIAAGNQPSVDTFDSLVHALKDPEPVVRQHAAWAIGRLPDEKAKLVLRKALEVEDNHNVLAEIKAALS